MKDYFPEYPWPCKCGCGYNVIDPNLVERLNIARNMAKIPFVINSACRCNKHNEEVGGTENSAHLYGNAVDIKVQNDEVRFKILQSLIKVGFTRIGIYSGWIHVDNDQTKPTKRTWVEV